MKNKLYTKSYFIKRLKEKGFSCETVYDKYNPKGKRYWTIIVDSGRKDIMITCVKKSSSDYNFLINLESVNSYRFETGSMDVIIGLLSDIVNEPKTDAGGK